MGVVSTKRSAVAAAVVLAIALHLPARAEADREYRPLGISLIHPVALFHGRDTVIVGASVNLIYGRARAVYGIELGLVNRVTEDVGVLQVAGFYNEVGGGCYGICAAGFINLHGRVGGAQLSLLGNDAGSASFALQVGLINVVRRDGGLVLQFGLSNVNNRRLEDIAKLMGRKQGEYVTIEKHYGTQRGLQLGVANGSDSFRGLQLGLFNITADGEGLQAGGFNLSEGYGGIQLGAFNYARRMHGLQLGVINIAKVLKGVQIGAINIATSNKIPVMVLVNAGF